MLMIVSSFPFSVQVQHDDDDFNFDSFSLSLLTSQNQYPTFLDLTKKLQRYLNNNVTLNEYNILVCDRLQSQFLLYDDATLELALNTLRLQRLDLYLYRKQRLHRHSSSQNTVPLIRPKVIRWDHTEQRKDSGISLDSHIFPSSTYSSKNTKISDKEIINNRPSLDMILLSDTEDDDVPSISDSVDSSPSSSPSTVASSSPPSPLIQFSTASATTMESFKTRKLSTWSSSTTHPSPSAPPPPPSSSPVYHCTHVNANGKSCGQTFQRPYDLSRHQTIHLKNRPFVYCQQCGKRFTRVDALRRHERVQGHHQLRKQKHLSSQPIFWNRTTSTPTVTSL
ncbi:uncharacterized protein BX664DRAFT_387715 [Halteromyces radiatus]|uniref:uncharacterized protein n=1 Tax=Halteromyces radiatus TaxID=101107 RepID=UPI0022209DCE|nr:uncharacterized protein BX664DRAFT_387715 [Halteromyces radiatus]KAI8085077.1 hypothetical protein BX664DRAFT_387715 [Halteromyces radiatus]